MYSQVLLNVYFGSIIVARQFFTASNPVETAQYGLDKKKIQPPDIESQSSHYNSWGLNTWKNGRVMDGTVGR